METDIQRGKGQIGGGREDVGRDGFGRGRKLEQEEVWRKGGSGERDGGMEEEGEEEGRGAGGLYLPCESLNKIPLWSAMSLMITIVTNTIIRMSHPQNII